MRVEPEKRKDWVQMKKRLTVFIALMLCAALMLCGCTAGKGDRISVVTDDDKSLNKDIVMTVGEQKISQADFNFIYKLVYDNMSQYANYYGADWENMEVEEGKTMADFMQTNTIEQVKQMAAAVALGKDYKITADRDVQKTVTEQKKNIVEKNYNGVDGYRKYLLEAHTTDAAFDRYLEICEIYSRLFKELSKSGGALKVDEKKLEEDFIKENEGKMRVQHVLISTQEQQGKNGEKKEARSDADAKKLANEVIAQLDSGKEFDNLIEKYNEDPGMSKGKYYLFGEGEMVPEFEEASKNLKVGEYTKEPVKTSYGYHVIKRYEIDKNTDEFKTYKENALQEKLMKKLDKKLKKLKVSTEEKTIEKYLKKWSEERAAEAKKQEGAQKDNAQNSTSDSSDKKQSADKKASE